MPQLLLELFTEEIPARMQGKAASDLEKLMMDALTGQGLMPEGIKTFAGPRRLTAVVEGLAVQSPAKREERKGPKVDAPEKAVEGFMRAAGLIDISEAQIQSDPKKGDFYVAVIETPGRDTPEIICELVPALIRKFPWPKSMRWGSGTLTWVRPLQRIVCTFDGEVVPFEVDGIQASNLTEGHRLMGRGPFKVRRFEDYEQTLRTKGHVVLDAGERAEMILADARTLCQAQGLELIEDAGLLDEVAGLAEWPVVLMGDMDPAFLELPPEVIQLSMKVHQKYFAVRDPNTGKLAPKFIVVANQVARDGGRAIAAGNARVLSARLNDARFFWENDKAHALDDMAQKLATITFKEELGTLKDKTDRVAALGRELAPFTGADPDLAERAARLAKADLVSEMVYEFPELQGLMGRYYALEAGDDAAIANAIADHYKPQGPSDAVPTAPVSIAVALADKIDTLTGFWAIDEKPTGSKDPFALRRAALGVVRIALENSVRIGLSQAILHATASLVRHLQPDADALARYLDGAAKDGALTDQASCDFYAPTQARLDDLLAFIFDRLKVALKDEGIRHDVLDAVFAVGGDDLVSITNRARALQTFLSTEDGRELVSGYTRASNILAAEEKKDARTYDGEPDGTRLQDNAEIALHAALSDLEKPLADDLTAERFGDAMARMARLRPIVDAFFETVTVNADTPALRENRLKLLSRIRAALQQIADFSRLEKA